MKILRIRVNPATNSSSTHSIVYFPNEDDIPNENIVYGEHYGWEEYVLTSKEEKLKWLSSSVYQELQKSFPDKVCDLITKNLFSGLIEKEEVNSIEDTSPITIPVDCDGLINEQYLDELISDLCRDNVVCLGGNDNSKSDWMEDLEENGVNVEWRDTLFGYNSLSAVKNGNQWTLFNRKSGTKVHFSFDDNVDEQLRPKVPELVDMKITNKCLSGCSFCYQGSLPGGAHSNWWQTSTYLDELAKMGTFEVVLGGGEPTLHHDFINIIRHGHELGLVMNFTTRSLDWIDDLNAYMKHNKKALPVNFAYTVGHSSEVKDLMSTLNYKNINRRKIAPSLHVVLGTVNSWELEQIFVEAKHYKLPITLLGFKTVGRGENYKQRDCSRWITIVKKVFDSCHPLSIDTVVAQQYESELKTNSVDYRLYDIREGFSSCYIDAVEGKIGIHSFGAEMVDLWYGEIKERFEEFDI